MNSLTEAQQELINVMLEVCNYQDLNKKLPKEVIPLTNEIVTIINAITYYDGFNDVQYDAEIAELFNYAEELFSRIIL